MPYKYTGKEYDPETKLTYYGARYYDAKLSRWISVDPPLISGAYLPQPGGDGSQLPGLGGVFNPINLDAYQYAGMNPVKYVDPDGNEIDVSDLNDGQKREVLKAFLYISQSKRGKELVDNISKPVKDGGMMFKIKMNKKARVEYDTKTQTIHWDSTSDLEVFDTEREGKKGKQSPALGLAHELGHADQHCKGRGSELIKSLTNEEIKYKVENDNLYDTEIPIAEQLNNKHNRNEGIRREYRDVVRYFNAKGVKSNEEK